MVPGLLAESEHDRRRCSFVHPEDHVNPAPYPNYDLVVGTAGLVSAIGAGLLGARVALVERALLGGDCLTQVQSFGVRLRQRLLPRSIDPQKIGSSAL